jgi:NADH-quinone oxidoreductase subunit H
MIVESLIKIGVILGILVGAFAPVLLWMERRQSAVIQDRLGPILANAGKWRLFGFLHPLADAIKFIWKEDFVPAKADRLLHALGPLVALIPALVTFAVVPFGDVLCTQDLGEVVGAFGRCAPGHRTVNLQIADLDVGILYLFAVAGTGVIGAAIAGYASNNKYALLGGLRAASQMVSYEVTMGLAIVGCLMVFGTVQLGDMVRWQIDHVWGIAVQPAAFVLFFAAAVAETKRVPFDLPEGESEIVAGYFLEYSGMKFGMFFMAEFVELVVLSAVLTTLFLGGWHVPFLGPDGFHFGGTHVSLAHGVVAALQIGGFWLKVLLLCWVQQMVRWTLPRFRYDQVMRLGWIYLLPLSLANIVVTGLVMLAMEG